MGIAAMAFNEGKVMIEAQQQAIDQAPGAQIMPTSADKGVTICLQVMRRLAREDHAATPTATAETNALAAAIV
jgi:hypothetical protein